MTPVAGISRVLVGVDFDEASASALKMAGVLASTWDAEITVFHASTPDAPAYFTADQIDSLEVERAESRAMTADRLRVFAAPHVGRAVQVVVEEDLPGDALIRMAAEFDLIVLGTHRRHGARSTLGGDVVRSPDIYHCAPDRLQNTDLIVLSMPADSDTHFGAIVQVLKACLHPVLFVPSTKGIVEGSPS
jgi:nucleotide-binding universal stress UspA family protein